MARTSTTPPVERILAKLRETPAVRTLRGRLERGESLSCTGVSPGAQPLLAVLLHELFPQRTVVLVAEGTHHQENLLQDVETWWNLRVPPEGTRTPGEAGEAAGVVRPLFYPAWEILPHEDKLPAADVLSDRLETLRALEAWRTPGESPVVVTSVVALMQRTFPPVVLRECTRLVKCGQHADPLDLVEWLEDLGYEPEVQVNHKGEIALRGGILDIYPLQGLWPVRLEFFGDEIESIRWFDPLTQVSREAIDHVVLSPGGELGLLKRWLRSEAASRLPPGQPLGSLADYLPPGSVVLLSEPQSLEEHAAAYAHQVPAGDPFFQPWNEWLDRCRHRRLAVVPLSLSATTRVPGLDSPPEGEGTAAGEVDLGFTGLEVYRPLAERPPEPLVAERQRRDFFEQMHRWLRQGFAVHVFCNNDGEQQRLREIWSEYGLDQPAPAPGGGERQPTETLHTHLGALTRGFLAERARVVVVTDAEVFGRYKVVRPRRLKLPQAVSGRSMLNIDFKDLEEGDYVVHLQHGIGRFVGLATRPAGGGVKPLEKSTLPAGEGQECLVIEYAPPEPDQPPPRLYVPVSEAHLVGKYVGAGKARPQLHTLGGTRWRKAKARAEQAVRDLAGELLAIQAARESFHGHSFGPDTPWQREFEGAFIYQETPDQLRAIQDTKADMERSKPMDRLICGDVGYGKTEVAIRAAFKAVLGGKQVAVLVPTTVLAQQHYNTFTERMADYPVRVELLSRFRTARQQTHILSDLARGAVDILVGTHRLIQGDVSFKDLGLVIIDEEQRFGVLHKENFKRLRRLVDVLTLSATPIPRTLYLALAGARDMSTIETAPQDRLPVETIVCEYDERVIRDAIQRELNRQGQVFYLHNRVFDIQNVAQRLRTLLPHARIAVGHGQMHADELERVMTQFVNGQADVLLSTTIIESGLDIPNANTIIIDRADRFGLSDLYQLRGRVGRYKHQAYAYLLIPRHARMLTDARKRISAIKQYSALGSGFKIAMRDLEIRGAGNLLGPEQSGHITEVGFDLYCQLLKQSVSSLKGEPLPPRIEVQLRLDFVLFEPGGDPASSGSPVPAQGTDRLQARPGAPPQRRRRMPPVASPTSRFLHAFVPAAYIPDSRLRIEIYRKLAEATASSDLEALGAELRDRFGPLPGVTQHLLEITRLKLLAAHHGVTVLETEQDKLKLFRNGDWILVEGRFPRLTHAEPMGRLREVERLLRALGP